MTTPFAGGPLKVTEAGVGPINASTPFSAEAIAALFPNAEVTTATAPQGEGSWVPVIRVRQTGMAIVIDGDFEEAVITRIHVRGDNALGPNGERQMDRGGPTPFSPDQCKLGPDRNLLTATCRRTADSHVLLTYTVGDFAPPQTAATPYRELIAHGFLADIVWERSPAV